MCWLDLKIQIFTSSTRNLFFFSIPQRLISMIPQLSQPAHERDWMIAIMNVITGITKELHGWGDSIKREWGRNNTRVKVLSIACRLMVERCSYLQLQCWTVCNYWKNNPHRKEQIFFLLVMLYFVAVLVRPGPNIGLVYNLLVRLIDNRITQYSI